MSSDDDWSQYAPATRAIRAGQVRTPESEHNDPIFLTSSFCFSSAQEAAEAFSGDRRRNVYSRFTNPTVRTFQDRLAAMEGGEACVATSSGMAAILSTCLGLLRAGDHVVCSTGVFGSTTSLLNTYMARFGVTTSWVSPTDVEAWREAMRPETKLLFLETPTNPLTEISDIPAIAAIAHEHGALLAVDNCFLTSVLQRPLELGADIVIHSATKYIDGQGRCLGGAIVGDAQTVDEEIFGVLRTCGPAMSPFNAWVFLKGLETLDLRMRAHSTNAMELARWLEQHPKVERVHYAGLESHPQHELAKRQQDAFGGIVSFEVAGGQDGAWHVIDSTKLLSITANLGDAKTTITHPPTTTHGRLSPEQREIAGIRDGLVRVAVGLEDLGDIRADLARGLDSLP